MLSNPYGLTLEPNLEATYNSEISDFWETAGSNETELDPENETGG
jgi:hypothetical protein